MSELAQRRERMLEFLVNNVKAPVLSQQHPRTQNARFAIIQENGDYLIHAFSRPSEFYNLLEVSEQPIGTQLDNNHKHLKKVYQKWCEYVVKTNELGLIPGSILLQSETNFSESVLKNKSITFTNKIGFLHKVTTNLWENEKIHNRRLLGYVEKSILELRKHASDAKVQAGNGEYFTGLNMFNVNKEDSIEVNALRPIKGGKVDLFYKKGNEYCVVCEKVEGLYNHEECKKDKDYKLYAHKRNRKRYHQDNYIWKQRTQNIEFDSVEISKKHLEEVLPRVSLRKDSYKLAIIT